ncbi:13848_t:CDS:2, partial [Gigaspora margarita]
ENLPIVVNKVEIPIDVEVTKAKDYAVIVETDWLRKVRGKIDLAKRELEYKWKSNKYRMPITCWKRMTYNFGNPLNGKEESCTRYKELFQDIETLEYLVDNLDEELEISQETQEYTNLKKN